MDGLSSRVDERFFESILSSTAAPIVSVDEDGLIVFATECVEDVLGYTPDELVDSRIDRFVIDARPTAAIDSIRERSESEAREPDSNDDEIRFEHEDGSEVLISPTITDVRHDNSRYFNLLLRTPAGRDERAWPLGTDTPFRKIFEYSTDPLLIIDPEGDSIDACNRAACELLGYTSSELHDRGPSDIHPHEMETFRAFVAEAVENGESRTDELTCHTAAGETFPAEVSAVVIEYDREQRLLVRIRDLTDRRRVESEHRKAQELFKKIFEHSNDAILIFDPDAGEFTEVNPQACELLGYAREELLEMGPSDIHPHEIDAFREFTEEVIEEGIGWSDEFSCYTCDDELVPIETSMSAVELEGKPHIVASVHDISDRKEREMTLREERDKLSALFENSSDPIVEITFEADQPVIQAVNPAFEEVFGYSIDDVVGRTIEDVLVPENEEHRATHQDLVQETLKKREIEAEVERETVTGPRDFLLRAVPFDVEAGELGTYAIYTDITERKTYAQRLEALNVANQRLLEAETEAAIANTTVEIAHEVLEQPLVAMWSYDSGAEELVPLAATEPASELDPADDPGVSPIPSGTAEMERFHDGEPALVDDYGELDDSAHPETPLGTLLLYPLGEHCLLNIGFRTVTDVDPEIRSLLDLLAQNVQATLDRLESEQAVRRRSVAMAEATDGMGISDENGEFSYVNEALADMFEYDDPAALIGSSWERLYESDETERLRREAVPAVQDRGDWRGETVGQRADGTTFPVALSLAALDDGGIVCVVRNIADQKEHERQLEGLNEVARELMQADDRDEIAEIGVDACERVVGCERTCIRMYDHETNRLERVALTEAAQELVESQTAYDMEASLAGQAFRSEDIVINSIGADDTDPTSPFEYASFHVPIGAYGVLSVVVPRVEEFDDRDVRLTEMLAVNVRTAVARAERSRLFRNQQQELQNQRDQLETLNRINTLVQEIADGLVEATTREELERTICSHLAESELYQSAWIGDVEESADRIAAREGFGLEEEYLEAIDELSLSQVAHGTVERALESKEINVVRQYQLTGDEKIDNEETDPEIEATAAIPFTYGDRIHGVLVVNGVRPDVFGESQVAGFETLGRLAGFAVSAIRNRELLLSDAIVELELAVRDRETFYLRITDELDCQCQFDRSVPLEADKVANYHRVEGAEPASVLEAADAADRIEEARAVSERDGGFVLQTVTTSSPIQVALEAGATLRSGLVEDGEARITIEAPQSADVRQIVRAFDEAFESVELVAKRERERSVQTADEFRQSVDDRLTEKQRAAVEAAYATGYYDWPRETTAEELAESMGVSSSTLHQHLRKGIWSLLAAFFEHEDMTVDSQADWNQT